jgi:regulator of sirC expression with transglutaminase-like and TPR domain
MRFEELVRQPDADIDLARACLLIAADAYPGLDVDGYVAEIDRLAARLRADIPPDCAAEERVVRLNEFLFDALGFTGNTDNYYDPRNSYLNQVIDRRTGIPISLAILYMELGRRVGLQLEGISFPGHFLLRLAVRGGVLVIDPFSGGVPQSENDLRERLQRVIPEGAAQGVPVAELPLDQFLEPASKRQILSRLLRNLKGIYRQTDKPERLLAVLNRMLEISPNASAELRDRGFLYQRLECWRYAMKDLSAYLDREPDAADLDDVRAALMELGARCARLN